MFITKIVLFMYMLIPQASTITLNNGRYEDIYIVIQDSIDENLELLDRIQEVFTKASHLLFTATKNYVYFGKIKVVIPKSWSTKPHYIQTPAISSVGAYIDINNGRIKSPYVVSRNCGEEGLAMYLHQSFLLNTGKTDYGNHENVIVHEWGHLRWGLFDEYPTRRGKSIDRFYQHAGIWKPVGCSHNMQGRVGRGGNCNTDIANWCDINNTRKKMKRTCYFCPYTDQDIRVSLMAYQYIDKMALFCDKDDETVPEEERHNSVSPNAQNEYCNRKSAWEVMREHEDFKDSDPLFVGNTTPVFEFIQESETYIVLVLDVSGSMYTNNRIGRLAQAAEYIIQSRIPVGSWLGIVTFSTTASVRSSIIQVNTQENKNILIASLPRSTDGYTCIGCGMDLAITLLRDTIGSPANGELVLITDGQNNVGDINTARINAIEDKVKINTIAVSQQADTLLSDIAIETGGVSHTYLESGNISFAAVLAAAISGGTSITSAASKSEVLLSEKIMSNVIHAAFSIENGLGKNTSVTVLTDSDDTIHLQIKGPGSYTQNATVYGNTVTINIDGFAMIGNYNLTITTSLTGQTVEYHVTSSPTVKTNDVIRVAARLSKTSADISTDEYPIVYADVTKGNVPVKNATVIAIVESDGDSCIINLYDGGIDPDRKIHDGTYSNYIFPSCLRFGRVNIRVKVNGKAGETSIIYGYTGAASLTGEDEETEEIIPDSFQRNVMAEELYISNYVYDETVDSISPGRITDVEINNIETATTQSGENRNLTLTWTATGDDKNQGKATSYEMRISSDIATLRDNFESAEILNMTNSTINPQIVGTIEALKIVVNAEESFIETMFFAVRAIDEVGNKGPVSNIISIIVARGFRVSGEQGYAVNETDDDFILDEEDASESQSFDKNDNKDLIIGLSVSGGIVLLVTVLLFVKKFKQQKSSIADSQVSIITNDSSRTEVLPYHSCNIDQACASISLPTGLPFHTSPEIPSVVAVPKYRTGLQHNSANETSVSDHKNDGYSDKIYMKDETVIPEQKSGENDKNGNLDSQLTHETALVMEDYIEEFEDPDDYIKEMGDNQFPAISIPFYLTNKCEPVQAYDPNEAKDSELPNVKILDSAAKEKVLENLPALPFSSDAKVDRSHPPPNMAVHILEPGSYGIGKKPFAFPLAFSGVKEPFNNSEKVANTMDMNDDIFSNVDSHANSDDAKSETDSQLSLEYPDYNSEGRDNFSFEYDDREITTINDGSNLNKAENEDDFTLTCAKSSHESVLQNGDGRQTRDEDQETSNTSYSDATAEDDKINACVTKIPGESKIHENDNTIEGGKDNEQLVVDDKVKHI